VLEIGGLNIVNYGPSANVKALALPAYPYEGFNAKAWRPAALERIEKHRKGDAVVVIRDDTGHPLPNADVEVRMKSHQFGFGTAVQSSFLLAADAGTSPYRETFLQNFNRATPENDLKWGEWLSNRDRALRGLEWLKINGIKQVRGHNLIWPEWQYLPEYLRGFASNPSGLEAELERHIADQAGATSGKLSEWDVLNEPVTNTTLQKILGPQAMASWFKAARRADPSAKLYVNDYNLLEGGGFDTPHQAGLDTVLRQLDDTGAGYEGIGLQAHMQWQLTEPSHLYDILSRYAAYKRDIQVTEFDIDVEDPDLQAEYLNDFLTTAFSHPGVSGVTLWGFWEGAHFRPNAALWRRDWSMKPAARVWRDLVYNQWSTNLTSKTDSAGAVRFRGFGGSYEVVITINGTRRVIPFDIKAGQPNYILLGKPPSPKLSATAVVNGASFQPGAVAPGEIVALFGADFGSPALESAQFDSAGALPKAVGDVSVLVNGTPAEMLYSVAGQAGAVLPAAIRGIARIQVEYLGLPSNEIFLPIADASPGIFTSGSGAGQAAAVNASTGAFNAADAPAARGDILTFFATGLGETDPIRSRVLIGEREAEILFAGRILPGVVQFNVRIPPSAPIGPSVPVSLRIGSFTSQAGVTIALQ